MNWKTWTQLLAALVVVGVCVYIGKLILPVVQTMTPVIAWTLTAVIVVVLISLGLGVPAAIVMGLRALHTHHMVREIEARKLAVTERGFLQGYISRQEQLLIPQITAHSVEVPGHVHIEEDHSTSAAGDASQLATKILQEARHLIGGKYEVPALPPGMPEVPGPCTFSQTLTEFQPTTERLLIGYLPGRELATSTANGLCHVALAGATGAGKSSLIRLLIAQLCAVGATVLLLNPHYTRYDLESGEDWTPYEPYLHADPMHCREYRIIEYNLRYVAEEMLPARLDKYARSQPVGAPFYIVLDELPAIVKHVPGAPGWMADILREGRKVKLFLVTAAQDFLVKTVMGKDGSGAVRDCFRTAVYVGGDPTTARVLLDVKGTVDDGGLGRGVVILRSQQVKQAALARVPYVDNEALYRLLGPSTYERSDTRQAPAHAPGEPMPGDSDACLDTVIVEADIPEMEALQERPSNVRAFPKQASVRPDEPVQAMPDERPEAKKYLLTNQEIDKFIAGYKASGNMVKALAAIGKGSSYRDHARRVLEVYGLREEAEVCTPRHGLARQGKKEAQSATSKTTPTCRLYTKADQGPCNW